MKFDVALIGLGPAGIRFAQEALKCGLKTIAFEKSSVGGTCLNLGCIPTKTMLNRSEVFSCACKTFPLNMDASTFSYASFSEKKDAIVSKLSNAVRKELVNDGLIIVDNEAKVEVTGAFARIVAGEEIYEADKVIVATGSKPLEITGLEFDSKNIISSDDLLSLKELPKSILIVGSGAIGVEWARILNSFGCSVTVVEKAQNLLPLMDKDISARIERIFKISKIKYYKSVYLKSFNDKKAFLSDGTEIYCDTVLCAAGRKRVFPEFKNDFNLEIFDNCKTNVQNLFVIGDVSGEKMLAHAASYQAYTLFNNLYKGKEFKMPDIPSVIYGSPEIASIGINEQDILDDITAYKIYKLPVSYLPKAWCDDSIEGFIKIITKNGNILGAHIVSKEASALIMQISIAMKAKLTIDDLKEIIFPHPTYSEGILEALLHG